MRFHREAGAEDGMSSLFPTFSVSMLMLYVLLSPPPKRKNDLISSWNIIFEIRTCYGFAYSAGWFWFYQVALSVPSLQDSFVFMRHLQCLFLHILLLARILVNTSCSFVT